MKQVWILNHYATGPGDVGGTRHFHLAEYLSAFGWRASIIAASVDHSTGHQRLEVKARQRLEYFQGIPFLWINTPTYNGNGVGRVWNMLAYALAVLRPETTAKLSRPDVVIGSSVHPLAAAAGALLARRFKVPFIFEARDLWPQTLVDMGRLKEDAIITWAMRKLELWLYRVSERIIVLLPLAWQYIVQLGVPKDKIVWIPNGVDLSLFAQSAPKAMPADGSFTLMYFGAHGYANDLGNVLKAMAELQRSVEGGRIQLRLVGDGPLKPTLIAQARSLKLSNVKFEPSVPKREIPMLAAQADAFVISIADLPNLYKYGVSPNKLFDYFAAERPILIAAEIPNNPVAEANAGFVVPPSQPHALADGMLRLARTPIKERQRMGRSGRQYVEQRYRFELLAERLASILDLIAP